MAASYPTSVKTFGTRNTGDVIQASHVNELQDEVAAVETQLLAADTAYVPTWGNSGTANTLGNGTLTGSYRRYGNLVFYSVALAFGSTTVSGNGSWTFTFPLTSASSAHNHGGGLANDDGTASYHVNVWIQSTTVLAVSYGNPRVGVGATVPFTWTTNDSLFLSGWYFAV